MVGGADGDRRARRAADRRDRAHRHDGEPHPGRRGGRALGDAILYSDPCGSEALAAPAPALDALGAATILGNQPEPLMTAFKIGWLRQTSPEIFAAAACFLPGAKDALALRLTGRAVTDPVTATTTGLMDLARRSWSEPIAAALGIPMRTLPEILPASASSARCCRAAAADLGLEPGRETLVVNGCGDAGATTLGSFCRAPGDISLYLGTTGWVARVVDAAGSRAPAGRSTGSPIPSPGLLIEVTPILSAGAAAAWARSILGLSRGGRRAGAAGRSMRSLPTSFFCPISSASVFRSWTRKVRGAFLGLGAGHGPAALYYSVLEGVGFAIRANLGAVDPGGAARIRLAGGGARSAVWPQNARRHRRAPAFAIGIGAHRDLARRFPRRCRNFWFAGFGGGLDERCRAERQPPRAHRAARGSFCQRDGFRPQRQAPSRFGRIGSR